MSNIIIFIITSFLIMIAARKIKKINLTKSRYYVYGLLYLCLLGQYYSIFHFGMTYNGLEVSVIFFNDFFSTFLPNTVIQLSSLAIEAYLLFFCFPKNPDDGR